MIYELLRVFIGDIVFVNRMLTNDEMTSAIDQSQVSQHQNMTTGLQPTDEQLVHKHIAFKVM